ETLLADHRPGLVAARTCEEAFAELVVHGVEDHDAARRSTPLYGIRERRRKGPLDGPVEVRVVADDERVLPTQLEDHLREPCTRAFRNRAARLGRAREADQVH